MAWLQLVSTLSSMHHDSSPSSIDPAPAPFYDLQGTEELIDTGGKLKCGDFQNHAEHFQQPDANCVRKGTVTPITASLFFGCFHEGPS